MATRHGKIKEGAKAAPSFFAILDYYEAVKIAVEPLSINNQFVDNFLDHELATTPLLMNVPVFNTISQAGTRAPNLSVVPELEDEVL